MKLENLVNAILFIVWIPIAVLLILPFVILFKVVFPILEKLHLIKPRPKEQEALGWNRYTRPGGPFGWD